MKKLTKILLVVMAVVLVLACASCGAKKEDNKLVMATNAAFPPYEFVDDNGEYAGIDIELAQEIAKILGKELVIEDVEFGSIIGGVETGKYDVGIAGMTVTDERLESVNFSNSYATGVQVVIVKKDGDIKTLDDVADKGAQIGVQQDTTGHIYASDSVENGGYGEDKVTSYKTGADAVQALVSDKVDCVIIDNEPAKSFVEANEGLEILETEYVTENYAIAIGKDNEKLLNDVNNAIAELKANGKLNAIISKYIPAA